MYHDRLASARSSGDQEMWHAREVGKMRRTGNRAAEAQQEGFITPYKCFVGYEGSETERRTRNVGHLDTDESFTGDGGLDAHGGSGERKLEIAKEGDYFREPYALRGFHCVTRYRRAY